MTCARCCGKGDQQHALRMLLEVDPNHRETLFAVATRSRLIRLGDLRVQAYIPTGRKDSIRMLGDLCKKLETHGT
jgi:hypothetical protein